ncbi:MAG: SAF domain-containing protein, partial [Nitriliruptoraceae bacterium]
MDRASNPAPSVAPRGRSVLDGPPVTWPRPLDLLAERWWAARPRARTALGLLVVLLLLAAGTGHVAATPYGPPTSVLVATRDLGPGEALTDADLARRTVPADLVPSGALEQAEGV